MKTYDADYYIKKFEAIPVHKWAEGEFVDGSRCCALGHCGATCFDDIKCSTEAEQLQELSKHHLGVYIYEINDADVAGYIDCKSPRARVLKALRLIKSKIIAERVTASNEMAMAKTTSTAKAGNKQFGFNREDEQESQQLIKQQL